MNIGEASDVNKLLTWLLDAHPPTEAGDQAREAAARLADRARRVLDAGRAGADVENGWPQLLQGCSGCPGCAAPATSGDCLGCVGRGTGSVCCVCGLPITDLWRRDSSSPSDYRPDCPDCRAGRVHAHAGPTHGRADRAD